MNSLLLTMVSSSLRLDSALKSGIKVRAALRPSLCLFASLSHSCPGPCCQLFRAFHPLCVRLRCIVSAMQLSDELSDIMGALVQGRVPAAWMRMSYPSLRPLAAWMTDLHVSSDHI